MHYLIRDLNKDEKPREKLANIGAANLTDVELLALVIRSGGKGESSLDLARSAIQKAGGSLMELQKCDIQQLKQVKNIDKAKASSVVAAFELGRRVLTGISDDKELIGKPEDVVAVVRPQVIGKEKEYLYLVGMNTRNRLISKDLLSIGTVNETLLSPREIFKQAFIRNATSIVLVHNHPSNDPTPSTEDIEITQKLMGISIEIGIPLLDHIVICDNSFVSMKAQGLISSKKF